MKKYRKLLIKTAKELIQPYIDDFDDRSVSKDGYDCLYNGPGGRICAFSRACEENLRDQLNEGTHVSKHSLKFLKEEYKDIKDLIFWHEIQALHDEAESPKELKADLKRFVKEIKIGTYGN